MDRFDSRGGANSQSPATFTPDIPTACPVCKSSSITTTAKKPDVSSYWRCTSCGEIWNISRRDGVGGRFERWR